jgi:uncharacterized protein (DUF1800 family)
LIDSFDTGFYKKLAKRIEERVDKPIRALGGSWAGLRCANKYAKSFLQGILFRVVFAAPFAALFFPTAHADSELDLNPIEAVQWNAAQAAHLASRAGFGATVEKLSVLSAMTPAKAVDVFVDGASKSQVRDSQSQFSENFQHSGVFDDGLDPFPASRPATTMLAKKQGHALGVAVKAGGNRPLQPVVNKFFYWLRASRLETDRVAYWWANRMLASEHPLEEKTALFWHGHFASNEDKVRDYRKMLKQLQLFQRAGLGDFRQLLIGVAQDPAMLVFLDAGVNTKDSPNENFAREIMELFTMGVGEYGEEDVREAARSFTGWSVQGLDFYVDAQNHDEGDKHFLGEVGNFDGIQVIDRILAQDVTSEFLGSKLYRYFVRDELSPEGAVQLGQLLRDKQFNVGEFLRTLFLSKDFYQSQGAHIKSPVELVISTYKKMGFNQVPGVPDFNVVTGALGQRLMHPPTVAGWSEGRSWITPSLLFERGNFVLDVMFPDIGFIPPDRFPPFVREVAKVQSRLREGMSVSAATRPTAMLTGNQMGGEMAQSNALADRDEAFNTRLGSMRGWQMALERVKPINRDPAQVDLVAEVVAAQLTTPEQIVSYYQSKFFSVNLPVSVQQGLAKFLVEELGTNDIFAAQSYLEEPLRKLLHQMLSRPEYQLG